MQSILICDATLREAQKRAQGGLSFKERLEIARTVGRLKPYALELPPLSGEKADALLVKSAAAALPQCRIVLPAALSPEGIAAAWDALKEAKKPCILLHVPTSTVQMEYQCHKKPDKLLALISQLVSAARACCPDVAFSAGDATRSEPEFLAKALETAISAGAGEVTLCDTAGVLLPEEFGAFVARVRAQVPALKTVTLGVECSDALGLGTACAVSAVRAGAVLLKTTVPPSDLLSLSALTEVLRVRGVDLGLAASCTATELTRVAKQIDWVLNARRDAASPYEGGSRRQSDGTALFGAGSTQQELSEAVTKLGYDLSVEDQAKVYEAFQTIAARKDVGEKELDAIVASAALQVPPTYTLVSYVINSGNVITATAHIKLQRDGKTLSGIGLGDGPIDASFLAIEQIVGHHYELDDFEIQAVTEGREAMGSALVRLRSGGRLYAGKGISTDIIGASIRAYMNALNKIVYEENRQ